MTLRLRVFAGLSVTRNEVIVTGPASQRRSLALLAVLATRGEHGISREKLAALLWPEADEASARNSLKQAVYVARRELGTDVVLGSTVLRLGTDAISADLVDFKRALAANDFEKAVELYAGPFLDGFHLTGDSEEFEQWSDTERGLLARRWIELLEALASQAVTQHDHRTALQWWYKLCSAAPLDSRYALGIAESFLALGDRAGALRFAESHRALLSAELGVPLSAELEGMIARARVVPDMSEPAVGLPPVVVAERRATTTVPQAPTHQSTSPRRWRWVAIASTAALTVTAAAGIAWRISSGAVPVDSHRVAIVSDANADDNPSAGARTQQLREAIARRVTTAGMVAPVMLSVTSVGDPIEAARSAGAGYVIAVNAGAAGDSMADVALTDAMSRERIWGGSFPARDRGQVDAIADRTTTALAVRLDPRTSQWIRSTSEPSSYAAYEELTMGLGLFAEERFPAAQTHFRIAARDSGFTMAMVLAGWANHYAGQSTEADSIARNLERRRLPPLERAMVELLLATFAGNLDTQYQAALAIASAAPNSEWRYLLAQSALDLGRGNEAARVLEDMGPDVGWMRGSIIYWMILGRSLHYIEASSRELAAMTEGRRRFPTSRLIAQAYIKALVASGMTDSVEAEVGRALTLRQRENSVEYQPMDQAVSELLAHGYEAAAKRVAIRTLSWLDQQPVNTRSAWAAVTPDFQKAAGRVADARTALESLAKKLPQDRGVLLSLAVISAQQGDSGNARRIEALLNVNTTQTSPADLLLERAILAASLGENDRAVGFLQDAFRMGYAWRSVLHIVPGLEKLRGYGPYKDLVRPR